MSSIAYLPPTSLRRKKVSSTKICQAISDRFETLRDPGPSNRHYRAYPDQDRWFVAREGDHRGRDLYNDAGPCIRLYHKSKNGSTRVDDVVVPPGHTVFRWFSGFPVDAQSVRVHLNNKVHWLSEPRYSIDNRALCEPADICTEDLWKQLGIIQRPVPATNAKTIMWHYSRRRPYGLTSLDHKASSWAAVHIKFKRPVGRNYDHFFRYVDDPRNILRQPGVALWRHYPTSKNRLKYLAARAQETVKDNDIRNWRTAVNENYHHMVLGVSLPAPLFSQDLKTLLDGLLSVFKLEYDVVGYSMYAPVPGPTQGSIVLLDGEICPPDQAWCSTKTVNDDDVFIIKPETTGMSHIPEEEACAAIYSLYGIETKYRWG